MFASCFDVVVDSELKVSGGGDSFIRSAFFASSGEVSSTRKLLFAHSTVRASVFTVSLGDKRQQQVPITPTVLQTPAEYSSFPH
jgi:hypothetical protein